MTKLNVPRPPDTARQDDKKLYAAELSRNAAQLVANALRRHDPRLFAEVLPDVNGDRHESPVQSARGPKRLDVNFSTPQLGLGLGISIKTFNFKDLKYKSSAYGHNYPRVDDELRAEAMDYHHRQPYAVLVGLVFLPADSYDDAPPKGSRGASSFGNAVKKFQARAKRNGPRDLEELFERIFIGVYEENGGVLFFDVEQAPPRRGPPKDGLIPFDLMIQRVIEEYEKRNDPPFKWADDP